MRGLWRIGKLEDAQFPEQLSRHQESDDTGKECAGDEWHLVSLLCDCRFSEFNANNYAEDDVDGEQ